MVKAPEFTEHGKRVAEDLGYLPIINKPDGLFCDVCGDTKAHYVTRKSALRFEVLCVSCFSYYYQNEISVKETEDGSN
jgi:hypothetical protein